MPKLQVDISERLKTDLRIYTFEHKMTLSEATQEALEQWLGTKGYKGYKNEKAKT
ncbi:MAG: hypothetical protein ACO3EZ_15045 [Prochlorotrichaceae cyanobacterium]